MKSYVSRHEMPCFGGEENQHVLVRGVTEEALESIEASESKTGDVS